MPDSLVRYLVFLAEALTVVVLLAAFVVVVARASRSGRPASRLRVRPLGDHYAELAGAMRAAMEPRSGRRAGARAEKARKRERLQATGRPRVFVLDFRGDIRATRVAGLREEVTAVLGTATPADEVVLRLQNPGGTVNDQGLAASQLQRLRARGIPLTVCVDTVAASGGYMMACVADRIVAAPFAIVGSIGVVAQVPNLYRLLDRAGVEVEQFTGGEFKRTVTPFGRNTEADRAKLTEQIHEIHDLFKDFVATNRPQVDLATVATGEYWYGTRAMELNLVDELRTSDDYLLAANERADLYSVEYTTPTPRLRRLAGAMGSLLPQPR